MNDGSIIQGVRQTSDADMLKTEYNNDDKEMHGRVSDTSVLHHNKYSPIETLRDNLNPPPRDTSNLIRVAFSLWLINKLFRMEGYESEYDPESFDC